MSTDDGSQHALSRMVTNPVWVGFNHGPETRSLPSVPVLSLLGPQRVQGPMGLVHVSRITTPTGTLGPIDGLSVSGPCLASLPWNWAARPRMRWCVVVGWCSCSVYALYRPYMLNNMK